jgi:hypothetical protein
MRPPPPACQQVGISQPRPYSRGERRTSRPERGERPEIEDRDAAGTLFLADARGVISPVEVGR